jgi:hypothetical protein
LLAGGEHRKICDLSYLFPSCMLCSQQHPPWPALSPCVALPWFIKQVLSAMLRWTIMIVDQRSRRRCIWPRED